MFRDWINLKNCLVPYQLKNTFLLKTVSFLIIEKPFFKVIVYTIFFHINLIVCAVCLKKKNKNIFWNQTRCKEFHLMLYFLFIYYFFVISRFSFFQQNVRIHDWGTHAEISTHNMDRYRLSKLIIHINLELGKLFEIYYGVTVTIILEKPWYKICVYSQFARS